MSESSRFVKFMWKVDAFLYKYMTEKIPNFLKTILSPWGKNEGTRKCYRRIDDSLLNLYNFWDIYILPKITGE